MKGYKVTIDRNKCLGCGVAPTICPSVFKLGTDNGKNRVIEKYSIRTDDNISVGEVPEELGDCIKSAAQSCPVGAIIIEEIE